MYSEELKKVALNLRSGNKTFEEIGKILGVTKEVARQLCRYKSVKIPRKRGPKFKIVSRDKLCIKRAISAFRDNQERVNCSKILKETKIDVSKRTLQRYMKRNEYKYIKARRKIYLTKADKEIRVQTITEWFSNNQNWQITAFSDEKKFNLDGPDHWCTYTNENEKYFLESRQCKGGGIMIWAMILPNGLIAHRFLKGKFKSNNYVQLLQEVVVPILKLNYGENVFYQDDNCSVHRAFCVKEFMKSTGINTLKWPSKSPDINPTEDVWKMISERVYDGPQFYSTGTLMQKINEEINHINQYKREKIRELFQGYIKRLCKVLQRNGNLYNK